MKIRYNLVSKLTCYTIYSANIMMFEQFFALLQAKVFLIKVFLIKLYYT